MTTPDRPRLLFVCTHNRCRSLLSEVITGSVLGEFAEVKSAGTTPAESPHPWALTQLAKRGYETAHLASKSYDELRDFDPDIVVTVCDAAANEPCPVWLGKAMKAHWGLLDPSELPAEEADAAFEQVINTIGRRADALTQLLSEGADSIEQAAIQAIGEIT